MQCRSHAECLRRHPISECSASTPDRRRRRGSAPGPPAPALRRLGPGPPPARSSSNSESSEQLPSIAPRWPHSESLGLECARLAADRPRRAALRVRTPGPACCVAGWPPPGGRPRSGSVSGSMLHARMASINRADRLAILPFIASRRQTGRAPGHRRPLPLARDI